MRSQSSNPSFLAQSGPQVVGLCVFVLALWAQRPDAHAGRFLYDGLQLIVGKSLALGNGLTLIHLPDQPSAAWVHPFYPFLLGLVGRVWSSFPDNLVLIQIVDSASLGAAAWMAAHYVRSLDMHLGPALAIVTLGFISPGVLSLAASPFGFPLFLVLVSGAVILADVEHASMPRSVAIGLLLGAACLTLALGPAALAGVCVGMFARRSYRAGLITAATGLLVWLPWVAWSLSAREPNSLAEHVVRLATLTGTPAEHAGWLGLQPVTELLLPGFPAGLQVVGGLIAAFAFVVGCVSMFRRAPAAIGACSLCLLGTAVVPGAFARSGWILFPWFFMIIAVGTVRAWGMRRTTRLPVLSAATVLLTAYVGASLSSVTWRSVAASVDREDEQVEMMMRSINAELDPAAVIASNAEAMVHMYTGHVVVPAVGPMNDGYSSLREYYCDVGPSYVALSSLDHPFSLSQSAIDAIGGALTPVFRLTGGPSLYAFTCPS